MLMGGLAHWTSPIAVLCWTRGESGFDTETGDASLPA